MHFHGLPMVSLIMALPSRHDFELSISFQQYPCITGSWKIGASLFGFAWDGFPKEGHVGCRASCFKEEVYGPTWFSHQLRS